MSRTQEVVISKIEKNNFPLQFRALKILFAEKKNGVFKNGCLLKVKSFLCKLLAVQSRTELKCSSHLGQLMLTS
jgi:hypothetical protein